MIYTKLWTKMQQLDVERFTLTSDIHKLFRNCQKFTLL